MTTFKPFTGRIVRTEESERLYKLEAQRTDIMEKCAREWAQVAGHKEITQQLFWKTLLPQALYDTLETYSAGVARAVCEAWLKNHPEKKEG